MPSRVANQVAIKDPAMSKRRAPPPQNKKKKKRPAKPDHQGEFYLAS
jgi:hypothetical protein